MARLHLMMMYMGPKDQNISLYTIDYHENEDFYDEIYSEDNPLYD